MLKKVKIKIDSILIIKYLFNMETFFVTFLLLLVIIAIMSLGVMLMGKNIKGSCGGLNAISGSDKCSICNKDIDPNNPLVNQLKCKNLQT
jgi:hypothetical protein